jgi:hypothetical protein
MQSRFVSAISAVILVLGANTLALAQNPPTTAAFPWEGEVAAANVYVRSGAGANWYPTTKLGKGERVLVLGEKFGWYQITPPAGSFSFVDMAMVERAAGAPKGTIKQDKVYVRAGSKLESRKNSTQVVLNKGDTVDIIGDADGFLKITPPPGASLYISKQYVKPVDARLRTGLVERHVSGKPPLEQKPVAVAPPTAAPTPATGINNPAPATVAQANPTPIAPTENAIKIPTARPIQPAITTSQPSVTPSLASSEVPLDPQHDRTIDKSKSVSANRPARKEVPASADPPESTRYKTMLTVLESELVSLLARPLEQQDVDSLRKKYQEIATQTEENVPSQIAKIRVRQLTDRARLRLARTEILSDSESIAAYRANMDQERMKIMRRRVSAAMVKYDLEGELWRSYAFAPENRRFRLVDPANKNTIAYVDIPVETDPNPDHLIGRLVGITSSGQKFSPAARVPIAVAASITDLSPRSPLPGRMSGDEGRLPEAKTEPMSEPMIEPRQEPTLPPETSDDQQGEQAAPANSDETPDTASAARP